MLYYWCKWEMFKDDVVGMLVLGLLVKLYVRECNW